MTDELLLYLLIAFLVFASYQLFYIAFFMFRIRRNNEEAVYHREPVTVIVCAKNEAYNLRRNIPLLLEQKYYKFQVVVVDDCSTDDSQLVLSELKSQYPQLYYTTIPIDNKFNHSKKLAVIVAIKAAQYDHMVFIDADCRPASDMWLHYIMTHYYDEHQMVLGYGRFERRKGFLNFFIRYESFINAIIYFGYAVAYRPFMGVGRNLSYTKELYEHSSKFRNNLSIASGDDDMFVSEMGTRRNTDICTNFESQTFTEAKTTWRDWIEQKSRHLTTAPFYRKGVKFLLGTEIISRQIIFFLGIFLLILGDLHTQIIVASVLFVRYLLIIISLAIASRRMKECRFWPYAIFMDIIVPWIEAFAAIFSKLSKKRTTWR
ncbi:MAG: glycosyltransferase [Bacteroidales bacterium]|nr:glycosyltransferase [Bacteroidales bacterium]